MHLIHVNYDNKQDIRFPFAMFLSIDFLLTLSGFFIFRCCCSSFFLASDRARSMFRRGMACTSENHHNGKIHVPFTSSSALSASFPMVSSFSSLLSAFSARFSMASLNSSSLSDMSTSVPSSFRCFMGTT